MEQGFAVRLQRMRQEAGQATATGATGGSAEGAQAERQADKPATPSGLGLATRITTELVAAVLVGALIGFWLDRVFDTGPWLLLVFLLLGFAAALRNIVRISAQAEANTRANTKKATHGAGKP